MGPMDSALNTLSVDIGGTNTVFGIVGKDGNIYKHQTMDTDGSLSASHLVDRVNLSVDKFLRKNKKLELSERFEAQLKLNKLPKNSSKIRIRNRCEVSGRPHGVYRKLKISRIALRKLGLEGKIPGMVKSSW